MVSDPHAGRDAIHCSTREGLAGDPRLNADASGMSWSAVIAETAGAAALSPIHLHGAAFGFAVASPWIGAGTTAIGADLLAAAEQAAA